MEQLQFDAYGQFPPQDYVELALLRHGESCGNRDKDIVQGSGPDPSNRLTCDVESQAARLAGTILGAGILATGVWVSPLARARQTCEISTEIMDYSLPIIEDERLREMCKGLVGLPGGMEGRWRTLVETEEYWQQYKEQGWKFRHGSEESKGETAEEVGVRALAAMNDAADYLAAQPLPFRPGWRPAGLLYAHGQTIRFGVGAALGWPDIDVVNKEYRLGNCHGIIMRRYTENGLWEMSGRINPS
ncbi:MAG TPA: histidine phosphatase family protein [Patescibacteria group bacterium]|nr:histidine phosphatase family protein [Patescibacteria group bacterium]